MIVTFLLDVFLLELHLLFRVTDKLFKEIEKFGINLFTEIEKFRIKRSKLQVNSVAK